MPIALIAPEPIRRQAGDYVQILEAAGFEVIYPAGPGTFGGEELRRLLPTADVLMAGGERYAGDDIACAPRLKAIARTGVGYDAIDLAAASARKIAVTITPGTNQESVAEQAFALLLAVQRRIVGYDRMIRDGGWAREVVAPIRGLTLGLVGLGRIGRAMVPRAKAFGMHLIACDPIDDPAFDAAHSFGRRALDALLAEADVVSLHLPATAASHHLIDRDRIARMKPGAVLINTSRGSLVDEAALLEALDSGHLSGAGLDVFEVEPPALDNRLRDHPRVVSSPHVAGIDSRSMSEMASLAARCMVDVYRGVWPLDCMVNPEIATA